MSERSLLFVLLLGLFCQAHSQSTAFYVAAHPDDWIYFAPTVASDSTEVTKQVIIVITAGDAGGGDNFWSRSREKASWSAMKYLAVIANQEEGDLTEVTETLPGDQTDVGSSLKKYQYQVRLSSGSIYTAVMYCLRISEPDQLSLLANNLQASTQSLPLFGSENSVSVYTWRSLKNTILSIIQRETSANYIPNVNAMPYENIGGSHPNHLQVGRLVRELKSEGARFHAYYWRDYTVEFYELSSLEDVAHRAQILGAYAKEMVARTKEYGGSQNSGLEGSISLIWISHQNLVNQMQRRKSPQNYPEPLEDKKVKLASFLQNSAQ